MAFTDFFKKLIPKVGEDKEKTKEEIKQEEKAKANVCSLCQKDGADKQWMGQKWHTKCLRSAKKLAKKMI